MRVLKVKVISLPYIFQVLYVLCFTRSRYQVSVYRTNDPLVLFKVPVNIFQSCWDGATAPWVFISTLGSLKCFAQGHYKGVVWFERWTSCSGVEQPPRLPQSYEECTIGCFIIAMYTLPMISFFI